MQVGGPPGTVDRDSLISVDFTIKFFGSTLPTSPATLDPSSLPCCHAKRKEGIKMHLLHHAPTCHCSRAATIAAGTAAVSASTAAACPILLIVACPRSFCCCLPPPYRLLPPLPPLKRLQQLSPLPSALVAIAIDLPPLHLLSSSPTSLIAVATRHCRCLSREGVAPQDWVCP
jgi:hypothetical protein